MKEFFRSKTFITIVKVVATLLALILGAWSGFVLFMMNLFFSPYMIISQILAGLVAFIAFLFPPVFLIALIWSRRRKWILLIGAVLAAITIAPTVIHDAIITYNESITVDTNPNINVHEYLPFREDSKIVTLDHEASLRFTVKDDLPIVDGAAAVFPVYSAFVNAVYPDTTNTILPDGIKSTELYDGIFEYNNTSYGYELLAERKTDIFFGAYPSEEQITYAEEQGTTFVYTPIGADAFVFFVHKDNPIDNLTSGQIRKIYAGEITNWKDVGGKNEKIAAFQRNEGSGSQSMLIRFMGDTEIMDAPTEMVNSFMGGIVEQVADYKSKTASIGFSFRYYMEGIIQNPDIKLLSVDGVAPTVENIKSGDYPITGPLYAVTYEENDNENVQRLLDWILSPEGQEIIEKTGYAGVQYTISD